MQTNKKIELLAPAGSVACALAAFDAGADAIYCGLSKFNARERGENFTPQTLGAIVEYAHKLKRKVYAAVNTLIKENELPQIMEMLALLSDLEVDGLIVQDLGVVRLAREYFPNLAIHGSTQMGIHNSPGVALAKKLGMNRVILERQITLDEIRAIAEKSEIELEVFVHGALCCSLSGDCLFSSFLGGYSGNRGRCKQPCRRRFYSKNGNGFFFSPQDLSTLELLGEFKKIGIASLKIEGRLRQADYVFNTVSAYRMILDAPEVTPALMGEARKNLSKGCGRRWSQGFFTEKSMENLIEHENLGSAGMLCGEVSDVAENGFAFTARKSLHIGDRLRIQPKSGDDGPALTLTKIFVDNQDVKKAKTGDVVFVCYDQNAPFHGMIYKIGESFRDYAGRIAHLEAARKKINLRIEVDATHFHCETLNCVNPISFTRELSLASAEKHPVSCEKIQTEFQMSDSPVFAAGSIDVTIDGDYFFPAPLLKELRRDFWNQLKNECTSEMVFSSGAEALGRFWNDYKKISPALLGEKANSETLAIRVGGESAGNPRAIHAISIFDFNKNTREVILPEFTPEGRVETLQKAVRSAYAAGIRSFRICSLFELMFFQEFADCAITAADPLPVCNSMAALELKKFGVTKVQAHIELDRVSLEAFRDHSPLVLEVYRYGRPVLLVSRARIPAEGDIKDARTNEFIIKYDGKSKLTRVYPKNIVSVPRVPGTLDFYDITNANWNNPDTTTFNFESDWQ